MVLTDWVNSYENFTYYQWGIVIKKTNQLIGTISVVRFKEEINEELLNWYDHTIYLVRQIIQ